MIVQKKKNNKEIVFFSFAGFSCQIEGDKEQISYLWKCYRKSPFCRLISRQSPVNARANANLLIKVDPRYGQQHIDHFHLTTDADNLMFELECSKNLFFIFPVIEQVLRKIYYIMFFKFGGFILHASGIIRRRQVYLFTGRSGSGKSTIVKKLCSESEKNQVIADNNVYIRKIGGVFFVFPPPFLEWNLSPNIAQSKNSSYPVRSLSFLARDGSATCRPVSFEEALANLLCQIQIPRASLTPPETLRVRKIIFEFCASLARKNGLKRLSFTLASKVSPLVFR